MPRRIISLSLAVLLLFAVAPTAAQGAAWRWNRCRFSSLQGDGGLNVYEVKKTIRCAVGKFPVTGGLTKASAIAERESGFHEGAQNPTSSACGVYQFVSGTWDGVHTMFHPFWHRWELRHYCTNGRANVLAAIRYAHRHGWGPWGG